MRWWRSWPGACAAAIIIGAAGPAPATPPDGPPAPDVQTVRSPVLGSSALDPSFHDPSLYAPEPLPIETGAALDALIVDQVPRALLTGPETSDRGVLNRVERGGIGRLARRIGGYEVVVPVWTLHLGRQR